MSSEHDAAISLRRAIARIVREATGLHEQFAEPLAAAILECLRSEWGGERVYIAATDRTEKDERYRRALEEFNGRNHDEVCRRHGISRATLYRLLNRLPR